MKRFSLTYPAQLWLLLLPYLAGTFVLILLPGLATFLISFTKYNSLKPPVFIGLDNYHTLQNAPLVLMSARNTLRYVALVVTARVGVAFLLAVMLSTSGRAFSAARAAVYLPTVIPEAAYSLIWLWIFNPFYGPLNLILTALGLPAPPWLVEEPYVHYAFALMMAFQIGEAFVVLMAGLQSIPRAYYHAAAVDGANGWQQFWFVTLPLMAPWLLLVLFREIIINIQNTFTPSFVLTYGGPYYATTYIPLLIYEIAFDYLDYGLAAAVVVLVFLFSAILILGILNVVDAWREG